MYFITSIKHPDDVDTVKFPSVTDARCWGYYLDRASALETVKNDVGDIQEDYYNWLVVERLTEKIYPTLNEAIWFKWDTGLKVWVHQDNPNWIPKIYIWAIG